MSYREEIGRHMKNSLNNIIYENNEILRGLKFLSRRVKLSRRVSKKRRLRSGKLGQARNQCEELEQEYAKKHERLEFPHSDDELQFSTVGDSNQLEYSTVGDSNELEYSTVGDSNELEYSTAGDVEELKLGTVDDDDEELKLGTVDDDDEFQFSTICDNYEQQENELIQEYENKMFDILQEQLNVTFDMRDDDVRYKLLGDALFYYLMRGEEPNKHVQNIIHRLDQPLYNHTDNNFNYSWSELCCWVLFNEETFIQFYERLDNNETALEDFLSKRPQLMLNKMSWCLVDRLIEYLPYDNLHPIIKNIRNKNGQTCLFYINCCAPYDKVYINHVDDLYELLSIRNTTGQTALHVNTDRIIFLLSEKYTPKQRDTFIKLTSITDNNNQTALQVSNRDDLRSLIRRVENNEYITRPYYTNILIIYNTNNRERAEREAQIIYNACKSKYRYNITLKKNKSEDEIIGCITHSANEKNELGDLPTSLIVILMSHGNVGTIDDYHGNPIKLSDIEAAMCCNHLDGKPKMLITQCCQIGEESVETPAYTPTHEDFCAVMSCVAGEESTRGVFIGKLAEQIRNSKDDTDISEIVTSVREEMEREEHKQPPIIRSTLTAKFNLAGVWLI